VEHRVLDSDRELNVPNENHVCVVVLLEELEVEAGLDLT
jgi:hypothetical protein